jgi:hypothetical protein
MMGSALRHGVTLFALRRATYRLRSGAAALAIAGVFLATTSIALAHNTGWVWTEAKAERIVVRDAAVRFPPLERASLERELRAAVALYLTLEQTAGQEEYERSASRLHNLRYRSSHSLEKVLSGLEIEHAECTGLGASVGDDRYRHFRCLVTSEEIEIPSAVVTWEEGKITEVVEGQPRIVGPLQAQLSVHITGKSTITYRQIG